MLIRLQSERHRFDGGEAAAFRMEWSDDKDGTRIARGHCAGNEIRDLNLAETGTYELWLIGSSVECLGADGRFVFTQLKPWLVEFTGVRDEVYLLKVPQTKLYRMTVLQDGGRARHCKIMFYSEMCSMQVQGDENGQVVVLDDPAEFVVEVEHGMVFQVEACPKED